MGEGLETEPWDRLRHRREAKAAGNSYSLNLPLPRQSFTRQLTFRNWKSLLNIHMLKGTRPERIQCIIYGRLITIIMLALISSYASWYAEDYLQRELSLPKLINWLKRKNRLVNAMHDGTLEALLSHLRRALPKLLCKQRRKRRTSRQLIAEYEPYMEDALAA